MNKEGIPIAHCTSSKAEMKHRIACYNKGLTHGVAYAVRCIAMLKSRGYNRVQEVVNILNAHADEMTNWRNEHIMGKEKVRPTLSIEPWHAIRKAVFEKHGWRCVMCGQAGSLECDHIIPVSEGGLPTELNLRPLCQTCHKQRNGE